MRHWLHFGCLALTHPSTNQQFRLAPRVFVPKDDHLQMQEYIGLCWLEFYVNSTQTRVILEGNYENAPPDWPVDKPVLNFLED